MQLLCRIYCSQVVMNINYFSAGNVAIHFQQYHTIV